MNIYEGRLYFIKDYFIDKYNEKYKLMDNKQSGRKRPTYFCIRDKYNSKILWFVPMSKQYLKYQKIYKNIKSKIKKEPNNFVFANNIASSQSVFLIQNMFPTIKRYIVEEYRKNNLIITVPYSIRREILKKVTEVFALSNQGKIVTFTNITEFEKNIKKDLQNEYLLKRYFRQNNKNELDDVNCLFNNCISVEELYDYCEIIKSVNLDIANDLKYIIDNTENIDDIKLNINNYLEKKN